jgi:hypothetical protein
VEIANEQMAGISKLVNEPRLTKSHGRLESRFRQSRMWNDLSMRRFVYLSMGRELANLKISK